VATRKLGVLREESGDLSSLKAVPRVLLGTEKRESLGRDAGVEESD